VRGAAGADISRETFRHKTVKTSWRFGAERLIHTWRHAVGAV
jgi:uncharacterized membrane protein YsdA (DUF1294 family)